MSNLRVADRPERAPPPERALRVLMVSSEVDPFARTGGLGDVVSGLSATLAELGGDIVIVTPLYGVTAAPKDARWWARTVDARIGWGATDVRTLGVLEAALAVRGKGSLRVCFLDHPDLFRRAGLYGDERGTFGDNDVRFVALSRGALAVADRIWPAEPQRRGGPDVVHAHDWHAAPAILSSHFAPAVGAPRPKTVLTIHNLGFQGVFGEDALERLALPRAAFDDGTLAHEGQVNFMHGAIVLADRVTTVSPTYAGEIQTPHDGCGLDALLREHAGKLSGVLNGIDEDRFDPSHDGAIALPYDAASPFVAKAACKRALAAELGLDVDDGPLFASVSRLTEQKGIDLLLDVIPALVGRGARVALVGQGEPHLEQALRSACERHAGRVACRIAFDGGLARRVYAGADFFVAPSRYEPCGLTQLYAMRYGALPIVTAVGGLRDTVMPIEALFERGTGWVIRTPDAAALLVACEDAIALHGDRDSYRAAVVRAMHRESSWRAPAAEYRALYASIARGDAEKAG